MDPRSRRNMAMSFISISGHITLRPKQNGRHFPDDILKWIFFNENAWISIEISLKFVPKGQINNIPALVQIMAWCRPGDKPLSEPMMVSLLTHIYICVTRPQWDIGDKCRVAATCEISQVAILLISPANLLLICLIHWRRDVGCDFKCLVCQYWLS